MEPSDLSCTLLFCVNATDAPLTDGSNYSSAIKHDGISVYDFSLGERIRLGKKLTYKCKDGFKRRSNEILKVSVFFFK